MPETEVKEVPIGELSMAEYNKARDEGKTVVELPIEKPVEEKPEEKEEAVEPEKVEEKPKGKGGFQKKIDRLIKEAALERERADKAEQRAKELESKNGKSEETAVDPNAKPNQDNYKTFDEYLEALTDWKVEQKLRADAEAAEREAEVEQAKESWETYEGRINAAREKYDDYDETVDIKTPWNLEHPSKLEIASSEAFRVAVVEDENAAEILYHYGKHPDELMALGALSPAQVVKAIARLSDKLGPVVEAKEETEEKPEEKPEKIVSKAAPPIRPVGTGSTKSTIPLDKMSMADYNKARDAGRVR